MPRFRLVFSPPDKLNNVQFLFRHSSNVLKPGKPVFDLDIKPVFVFDPFKKALDTNKHGSV